MKRAIRILIVEDDERVSSVLTDWFSGRYAVEVAADGSTAVARATAEPPDVMLLDINIPGISGLEVLKRVRKLHPNLPVIMVTGTSDEVAVTAALMRGAFAYIPKPCNLQYVEHLVDAARSSRPA
jgi:two-component system, OmpR family, response regulator ResD